MLRFILGTAGTGKTTTLLEQVIAKAKAGERCIVLVPEQFSFETERQLFRVLGPKGSLCVEVLSFTRLCSNIFRTFGGLAGRTITPVGKTLLMFLTVSELIDQLVTYKKSAFNTEFLSTMIATCAEFKTAGITPEDITQLESKIDEPKLSAKLNDIALLYSTYQALLEQGYVDADDDLIRACQLLENHHYFKNIHLFIDGFTTFMAGEFELLGHALAQASSATFAMTADTLYDHQKSVGVFSPVQAAIASLQRLAAENSVAVEAAVLLETPRRYQSPALAHLSKELFRPLPKPYDQPTDEIALTVGKNSYDEIQKVAAEIARLVQEQGYRYQEIAVIAREHSTYLRLIEIVFEQYQIPFFDDRTKQVENYPLSFGLLTALEAVRGNFDGNLLMTLAKSAMLGFTPEQAGMLENYFYVWRVKGKAWEEPFLNNPEGLLEEKGERTQQKLDSLNLLRERLITPLQALKTAVDSGIPTAFVAGVYDYLVAVGAGENLLLYAQQIPEPAGSRFLEENALLWDTIVEVLDLFFEVLGERKLGKKRLLELFRLALTTTEFGTIPQTLDQVLVGAAPRIRPWQKKAVFVIGANEGVFPPNVQPIGMFSNTERTALIEAGAQITPADFKQTVLERFFAYFSMNLASDFLMVSYATSDLQGRELLPSVLVSQLKEIFPLLARKEYKREDYIFSHHSAFSFYVQRYREQSVLQSSLKKALHQKDASTLRKAKQAAQTIEHTIHSPTLAGRLFGKNMRLSPTRVERYQTCPFRYYVQDGLQLRARKRADYSALESGSLIHFVLQQMLELHGGKGLAEQSSAELKSEVDALIEEYLLNRVKATDSYSVRFRYLFLRLSNSLTELLLYLGKEFAQSEFQPTAFELEISREQAVQPLLFITESGTTIVVEGVVDRVDTMEKNGKTYLRVVDYKSGKKELLLSDVVEGINLQLLLYLFTLEHNAIAAGKSVVPAGVLYLPVLETYATSQRGEDPTELRKEREKQWKMQGLLLADETSLLGMERALEGVYIPAVKNKDGSFSARSSLVSYKQLGLLRQKIATIVTTIAEELSLGKIAAIPADPSRYPTCTYCEYRSVCGYEDGNAFKEIPKKTNAEVLEELEGEHAQTTVDETAE